jgi:hypothetical protein
MDQTAWLGSTVDRQRLELIALVKEGERESSGVRGKVRGALGVLLTFYMGLGSIGEG